MAENEIADFQPQEEVVVARGTRPSTDTNIILQLIVGVIGTLIVYFAVSPLKGKGALPNYVFGIIRERGPVPQWKPSDGWQHRLRR